MVRARSINASMLGIIGVRIRPISIIAEEFDLLSMNTPTTNRLVPSSSPSSEAREDERDQ